MNPRWMNQFILLFIALFFSHFIFGQKTDSSSAGQLKGSVRDTTYNYFLQSATVTINRVSDAGLVAYTMTNSLGEFTLKGLPTETQLRLSISFIGYKTYSQLIRIPLGNNKLSLGRLTLERTDGKTEDSVVVSPPPVRMNGDTLEFSAAAFALDKNAVAEDLLKKLPGVIIWGDGTITVNGRQISQLLVDGKPFFGGEAKIATQNIPKNAIEKVQVYQQKVNPFDPLDSITTVNLKLRKDKHFGYFGALSAGTGSDGRYEAAANANIFYPRTQIGIAGQSNNINRMANNLATLLRNNTFKGGGVSVEYQPDFNMQGYNKPASGGLTFSHDFIPEFDEYKQERLTATSFVNHNWNQTIKSLQTVSYISKDSSLRQANSNNMLSNTTGIDLLSRYTKHKDENTLNIEGEYHSNRLSRLTLLQNSIYGSGNNLLSVDNEQDSSDNHLHKMVLKTSFDHRGFSSTSLRKLTNWRVMHSISSESGNENRLFRTNFASLSDPSTNIVYDRKYSDGLKNWRQALSMQLGDFSPLLFGVNRLLSNFHIQLKNDLNLDIEKKDNRVSDKDSILNYYLLNTYLSKNSRHTVWNEIPDLRVGRSFLHILANRYQKELALYVDAQAQFYAENNRSTREFQNFTRNYKQLIPVISLDYTDFHYGDYLDHSTVNVSKTAEYPSVDQRVALVDSSNVYYRRIGNVFLNPAEKYEFLVKYRHDNYSSKNPFAYGLSLSGGLRKNFFADSLLVDHSGRYTYFTINLDGNRYARASLFLNKAFTSDGHQVQLNLGTVVEKARNPGYLQYQTDPKSNYIVSQIFVNSDTASVLYTYKDLLAISLLQNFSYYRSEQNGLNNAVSSNTQSLTRIGVGVNVTKKLFLSSNVSYTSSATSGTPANRYSIWNASLAYRCLPANNLELKCSALDILNQNKGIVNFGNNFSYTHGTVNMLHRYYMASLTYFPRKFGRQLKSN